MTRLTLPPVLSELHALELSKRAADRLHSAFAGLVHALDPLEDVGEIVEAADGFTIRAFDGFDFLQRRFEGSFVGVGLLMSIAVGVWLDMVFLYGCATCEGPRVFPAGSSSWACTLF